MSENSNSCKTKHRKTFRPAPTLSSRSRPPTTPLQPANRSTSRPQSHADTKIKNPALAFVFNPRRDEAKEYHRDGDLNMYAPSALSQRTALKTAPSLVASINDFMTLYRPSPSGGVARSEYDSVQSKLCRLLRPSITTEELQRILDEDWAHDTKGSSELSRSQLFDSLFELCDVWCPGVEEEQYKAFFDQLRFRLRYEGLQNTAAYDILR